MVALHLYEEGISFHFYFIILTAHGHLGLHLISLQRSIIPLYIRP